ncbi:peptidoglycan-binding domain-containing protein [Streptomyces sp. NPDC005386]|uniref:peptidoglycan-binding domain-containing protein n=1 Tax=Streptomyces sp. NPDC005386 TaxID=3154562 RepID=UPI0033BC2319
MDCLLAVGNTGEGVRALQRTLRKCYGSTIVADGVFGRATRDALKYAQRQAGTQDDGV